MRWDTYVSGRGGPQRDAGNLSTTKSFFVPRHRNIELHGELGKSIFAPAVVMSGNRYGSISSSGPLPDGSNSSS